MLHFEPNNLAYKLVDILSVTGEFPTSSLYLVGKERVVKALVKKLTQFDDVRSSFAEINTKLLVRSGKGALKTIKLYKGAIPILEWMGADEYYKCAFRNNNFPADAVHKERNFRIAETVAMCMAAGIEFRPYKLPQLKSELSRGVIPNYPVFYSSKMLKQVEEDGIKKVMFTRVVGLLFSGGVGYAVYNTRNSLMKWNGNGECKASYCLTGIVSCNGNNYQQVDSAILLGKTDKVALATIKENEKNRRLDLRFDNVYKRIYFIPMNEFGARQLKIFSVHNWKEKLLRALFKPETRSYDCGSFEYDAWVGDIFKYSFLDGDIARLVRLKMAVDDGDKKIEIICFPHQLNLLKSYLGPAVTFKILELSAVEEAFGLK